MTHLPFLRQILTSENETEEIFSCSTVKLRFCVLEDVYLKNESTHSDHSKSTKISSKCLLQKLGLKCGSCNATYYGKTKRHFKVRICEHLGISHLTGKKIKIDENKPTAIQEHLICCNYSSLFEDFSILTRENNDFELKIMES